MHAFKILFSLKMVRSLLFSVPQSEELVVNTPCPSKLTRGGGSQAKSVVACLKMKIRKDPYCVDVHLGFTPHSTQFWVTPHYFSVNGVDVKVPIPHISSTFCKYCWRTWSFFVRKHPIPHSFCVILITYPYHTHS